MNTVLRYIGRKYSLEGASEKEKTLGDMLVEGVEVGWDGWGGWGSWGD